MQIEEYLSRYERYRSTYNGLVKALKLYTDEKNLKNMFVINSYGVSGVEALRREIAHRERVLRYANARLEAAISRMDNRAQANYIMCKYFYGMKNCDIATTFAYCERHIYRLAANAKKNLYRELVKLMPKPRRGETGKAYRFSKSIKKAV